MSTPPLLEVIDAVKHYRLPREHLLAAAPVVHALQGVSFTLQAGRSLGVVGESGSGKSTLARLVMALERPSAGRVLMGGRDLQALGAAELRRARADFQMVFQDPFGSLDPRQTVARIVAEPLHAQGRTPPAQRAARVGEMLEAVGLRAADAAKYPHEFSGGQRQRIAIARALVTHPRLIVADEPVSALDVSVQAQVLNLMQDLQDQLGVTYLFISHDLAVVDLVCDEVIVLYQGRAVEQGDPDTLFRAAAHPYTRALMQALPQARPGGRRAPAAPAPALAGASATVPALPGASATGPALAGAPSGCAFAPRCAHRQPRCLAEAPVLRAIGPDPATGHRAACHRAEHVLASTVDGPPRQEPP
ncbi:MAG: ATP-binding cassette domain-containing protein [Burkholderiales bacterium]|nr:ATP-binding cassette domain-containing protein [Burkholderiales bacterium]